MIARGQPQSLTKSRRNRLIYWIILFIVALAACGKATETPLPPKGTYPIDPLFRAYYHDLGGEAIFGPGISPLFRNDDKFYQYTVGALLMYDSAAEEKSRLRLGPLGRDMGVYELPSGNPQQPGERYVDGYQISDKFTEIYDRLGGEHVVGRPLTDVHKNLGKERYEQYFENVGFYWIDGDTEDAAHLIAYGDWKCDIYCDYQTDAGPGSQPGSKSVPIQKAVAKLGLDFTGFARTPPWITAEGQLQQVYDNVVLVVNPLDPEQVDLFPLPEAVGVIREAPRGPNPLPDMTFIPVEESLGYNVPLAFIAYIRAQGDFSFIGEPITHPSRPDAASIKQCFKNLCLEGRLSPEGELIVKPLPLGAEYEKQTVVPTPTPGDKEFTVQVWELYPLISSAQEQEIGVVAMSGGNPLENVPVEMTVRMPNGDDQIYRLAPTDENGETRLRLAPIEAKNGTLIPYKTCVQLPQRQNFCVMDSFLIWQTELITITPTLPPQKTSYLPFILRNFQLYVPALLNSSPTYLPLIANQN